MLEFTGGIGLGMNVGDLLELECPFHGHRILGAPAQEEGVVLVREGLGQLLDAVVQFQYLFHQTGQAFQLLHQPSLGLRAHAETAPQHHHQHHHGHQLGGEGLGGGHADLGPGAGHEHQLGLPHQGTLRHVADGQGMAESQALGLLQARQGVGRLSGLGQGDDEGAVAHHRTPVAEFARHFHAARYPGQRFQPVTPNEAGVIAGTAGDDVHALHPIEDLSGAGAEGFLQHPPLIEAALQGVGDGAGLLVDLLEHVVAVGTAFHGIGGDLRNALRALYLPPARIEDQQTVAADGGHVALLQEHEALGHRQQRGDVGGDEVFADADADDEWTAAPGRHQEIGVAGADHTQGIGPLQVLHRPLHGFEQREAAVQIMIDLMGDHLRVRLGGEFVALRLLRLAQPLVILDDAVVHHRHGLAANVGMGIGFAGHAMGGPAGMGDADAAMQGAFLQGLGQGGHLARHAHAAQGAAFVQNGDARRIVTAVLQTPKPFHENGDHVPFRHRAYDAAHALCLPSFKTRPSSLPLSAGAASPAGSVGARGSESAPPAVHRG